ncbi:Ubiquitin-protein ligase E3A [Tritrichomonas musculus]|uniref:HECT-type E3 ubiquitin transferase n=1 Tax=Tritrichomonas musculus TaxID=1915356 RepID=A0ABR2KC50_9EUKA
MASLAEQLIIHYFTQYTEGCDSIDCQEPECCSNKCFPHSFKSPNEAAYEAIKAALNHPFEDHLCPGVSLLKLNTVLQEELSFLDKNLLDLIHKGRLDNMNQMRDVINNLMNPELFPYILRTNQLKLSTQNLAISDDLIIDLSRLIQQNCQSNRISKDTLNEMSQKIYKENCNTFHHVRSLILLFCFEPFYTDNDNKSFSLINDLIGHIVKLDQKARNVFFVSLQTRPRILQQILDICQNVITLFIYKSTQLPKPRSLFFFNFAIFLMNLRDISSFQSSTPLPSSKFSNDEYTNLIDPKDFYRNRQNYDILFTNPAILSLAFKNEVFHIEQTVKMETQRMQAAREEIFTHGFQSREQIIRNIHLQLQVHRNNIVNDTVKEVNHMRDDHLNRPLMVSFIGEEALDAGGVSREYFQLLTEQLFSPDYGMFVFVKNKQYYWFSHFYDDVGVLPIQYKILGTVVALAVYNGIILPIRFPLLLYKKILGKKITLTDLQEVDPEWAKSMHDMLDMKRKGQDVADLYLNFTITVDKFGAPIEIPLCPNGENIDVTNYNVEEYVNSLVDWKANKSVQVQFDAFAIGFKKLFNGQIFQFFAPDELDTLVSGEEILEWEELQKNAKYKDGYHANSKVVKWFWEIFNSYSSEMKRKFLLFTTGSDRAPIGGLAKVIITIQKVNDPNILPVSHTCFNIFSLPNYSKKSDMKKKLEIALTQTEGFGLI